MTRRGPPRVAHAYPDAGSPLRTRLIVGGVVLVFAMHVIMLPFISGDAPPKEVSPRARMPFLLVADMDLLTVVNNTAEKPVWQTSLKKVQCRRARASRLLRVAVW
jgi:hypothetical protein